MTAHETLGVAKDATEEDIKRAYRHKSKQAHPDQGGSAEAFQLLLLAYNELTHKNTTPTNAAAVLSQLYASMISQLGEQLVYIDIQNEMRKNINGNLAQIHSTIQQQQKHIKLLQRLNKNCTGPSIIQDINNGNIIQAEKAIAQMKHSIKELEACLEYIEQVNYTPERPPQATFTGTTTTSGWSVFHG